jgi:hypothetical protein
MTVALLMAVMTLVRMDIHRVTEEAAHRHRPPRFGA